MNRSLELTLLWMITRTNAGVIFRRIRGLLSLTDRTVEPWPGHRGPATEPKSASWCPYSERLDWEMSNWVDRCAGPFIKDAAIWETTREKGRWMIVSDRWRRRIKSRSAAFPTPRPDNISRLMPINMAVSQGLVAYPGPCAAPASYIIIYTVHRYYPLSIISSREDARGRTHPPLRVLGRKSHLTHSLRIPIKFHSFLLSLMRLYCHVL